MASVLRMRASGDLTAARAADSVGYLSHWERGGVRGFGLSIGFEPPHPNPLPTRGEGAHRDRGAIGGTL